MILTDVVLASITAALASDSGLGSLAGSARLIRLFMNNIIPTRQTVVGDLTTPTFTGYADKAMGIALGREGTDPLSGKNEVIAVPALGGLVWAPSDAVNLPQTIYGWAMVDSTGAFLIGAERFPNPIILSGAGQLVSVDKVACEYSPDAFA